jgi:ParB family chromosome partitioning protein
MARKRLAPAKPDFLEQRDATSAPTPLGLGVLPPRPSGPPIAQVAGEASAQNALRELADDVNRARAQGRMVLEVPFGDIAPDHLARDRIANDAEEMRTLMKSIFDHGQRTPIEVTSLADGPHKYGLISGWRRIAAIQQLRQRTGDARFDTVLALLRTPKDSADAYVSMVEENEIRVGLSYFERARVAAEATKRGVFDTEKQALLTLFASASRPKRSRIRAFIDIYHALDGALRFPTHLPERLGLSVVQALRSDMGMAERIQQGLAQAPAQSGAEEMALLAKLIAPPRANPADVPHAEHPTHRLENGLILTLKGKKIEITGKDVSQDLFDRLAHLLA